jgi:hypothetical protein
LEFQNFRDGSMPEKRAFQNVKGLSIRRNSPPDFIIIGMIVRPHRIHMGFFGMDRKIAGEYERD